MNGTEETALAVIDVAATDIAVRREPEVVLEEAQRAAAALRKVLDSKPHKLMFGEGVRRAQYLEFEDWQTLGKFYGITAKVTSSKFVSYDMGGHTVCGFEAIAEAIVAATGAVVSSGEAMCLNDEEKWNARPKYEWCDMLDASGKKIWDEHARGGNGAYRSQRIKVGEEPVPLFQLRSMAQTRSCAKALRNCLSWVVVLAGYKPTPAEELPGAEYEPQETHTVTQAPAQAAAPRQAAAAPSGNAAGGPVISEAQGKRLYAIAKGSGVSKDEIEAYLQQTYQIGSIDEIPKSLYGKIVVHFGGEDNPLPTKAVTAQKPQARPSAGAPF